MDWSTFVAVALGGGLSILGGFLANKQSPLISFPPSPQLGLFRP